MSLSALTYNLVRLATLRLITCLGIAAALLFLEFGLHINPELELAWGIWSALLILCGANWFRAKQLNAGQNELFAYLLIDSALVVALVYVTGGASNPFITYLLVPIVISAATQSKEKTWLLCILAIAAYAILLFYNRPLPMLHMHHAGFNLHIIGMLLTFIISALFIAYFVVDMAKQLHKEQSELAKLREQSIQNEHVMLIASQAASTAHELGTPLTTMAVVLKDLTTLDISEDDKKEDLKLIQKQVQFCKDKLKQLVRHAENPSSPVNLQSFLQETLDQWLLMRPHASYKWEQKASDSPMVQYPATLQQAIINVLNNAMDASQKAVELRLKWSNKSWQLRILDHGTGMPDYISTETLQPRNSEQGLGIGLLLTHSSVQRLGGRIEWHNLEGAGCVTEIEVPFA